jgi:hypothetical protein
MQNMTPHARSTHDSNGVIDTACTIFAFENRSYHGEFGAEFKKALARESGVFFDEKKTEGGKSRETFLLSQDFATRPSKSNN